MGNISAEILSVSDGLQTFGNLDLVRIKSDKYTLLIMDNYMPVIGEINGFVQLQSGENTTVLDNIQGYFTHSNNKFSLLLKEAWNVK